MPQRQDDGAYPEPAPDSVVKKFDTRVFDGRWYISAGLNDAFDTFDCQVHFFNAPTPKTLYGQLNWRISEPDGEFFTRDTVQRFVEDEKRPGILYNHDNEYRGGVEISARRDVRYRGRGRRSEAGRAGSSDASRRGRGRRGGAATQIVREATFPTPRGDAADADRPRGDAAAAARIVRGSRRRPGRTRERTGPPGATNPHLGTCTTKTTGTS